MIVARSLPRSLMLRAIKFNSWLTAHRLRAHAFILALCLWSVYLWNMATPGLLDRAGNLKGTDFLHFYTLGTLALAHRGADLYNLPAQSMLVAQRVPEAAGSTSTISSSRVGVIGLAKPGRGSEKKKRPAAKAPVHVVRDCID